MRIWRFHEAGCLRHLRCEEVATPEPADDEALVRVHYAALNPADTFVVLGQYPGVGPLPLAVGRDGCGVIERPAANGRFAAGQYVIFLGNELGVRRDGTLAEYVAVPETLLAALPSGWTAQEGAAGALVHLTAWETLVEKGRVAAGDRVLITGASGGVGTAVVMQARAHRAQVVALSRSAAKRQRLLELGATAALDPGAADADTRIDEALSGRGADVICDTLGGAYLERCLGWCAPHARIALVGLLAGVEATLDLRRLLFKAVELKGVFVGRLSAAQEQRRWPRIVALLDRDEQRPLVDRVFPFDQVIEAMQYLRQGPMGKVLVSVPM